MVLMTKTEAPFAKRVIHFRDQSHWLTFYQIDVNKALPLFSFQDEAADNVYKDQWKRITNYHKSGEAITSF